MQARVRASFARQAMMATLGAELVSVERGRAELALPRDERFTQQHGFGRLRTDQRTKDYVTRRIAEGHSKLDAIRALKRYLAREVFTLITQRRREINATRIAA